MIKKTFFYLMIFLAAVVAQEKKPQIAVLDIVDPNLKQSEAIALTERLIYILEQTGQYTLLDRGMTAQILQEQGFQQSGCTSGECAVEVGQLLGVQKMVSCKIGAVGKYYTISIRLVDVATGAIDKSAGHDVVGTVEDVLLTGLRDAVKILIGDASASTPAVKDPKILKLEKQLAEKAAREAAEKAEAERIAKEVIKADSIRLAQEEKESKARALAESEKAVQAEAKRKAKATADSIAAAEKNLQVQAEAELALRVEKEKSAKAQMDSQKASQAEADKAQRIAKAEAERNARFEAEKAAQREKEIAAKQRTPEETFAQSKKVKVILFSGISGVSAISSGILWGAKSGHHKNYLAAMDQATMDSEIAAETRSLILGSITAGVSAAFIPLTIITAKKPFKESKLSVSFAPMISSKTTGVMIRGEF